ncbi:MAG TPA: hypothetical protein VGO92_12670 [Acidimicrobiales bacterium]|jgi:hypothetical protein|nr:hypothetical protein [Acidimicrobiales bacterium]
MTDPRMADHLVGLELQMIELEERRQRAQVQHDRVAMVRLEGEIDQLRQEMAVTAEHLIAS